MRFAKTIFGAGRSGTWKKAGLRFSPPAPGTRFFTTDTAASLRAIEIGADILLKATRVDGIYSADPLKDASARRYTQISYDEVLNGKLQVMDATAIVMCRDNNIPLRVFNLTKAGSLLRIMRGEALGTLVDNGLEHIQEAACD